MNKMNTNSAFSFKKTKEFFHFKILSKINIRISSKLDAIS